MDRNIQVVNVSAVAGDKVLARVEVSMQYEGEALVSMLERSGPIIALRDDEGRLIRNLTVLQAKRLIGKCGDRYVGVGNRRRVAWLRPRTRRAVLCAGSRTTHQMTNDYGVHIAPPLIREHNLLPGK